MCYIGPKIETWGSCHGDIILEGNISAPLSKSHMLNVNTQGYPQVSGYDGHGSTWHIDSHHLAPWTQCILHSWSPNHDTWTLPAEKIRLQTYFLLILWQFCWFLVWFVSIVIHDICIWIAFSSLFGMIIPYDLLYIQPPSTSKPNVRYRPQEPWSCVEDPWRWPRDGTVSGVCLFPTATAATESVSVPFSLLVYVCVCIYIYTL